MRVAGGGTVEGERWGREVGERGDRERAGGGKAVKARSEAGR